MKKKRESKLTQLFYKTLTLDSSSSRHLRIADIIAADEEEQLNDGGSQMSGEPRKRWSVRLQCSSPRRITARCLALLRRDKDRKGVVLRSRSEKRDSKRMVEVGGGGPCLLTSRSMKLLTGGPSSSTEGEEDAERYRKAASFNLGVAYGLLYIVAASKNELDRMAKLRTEMDNLLQNVRVELQNMNATIKQFEPDVNISHSGTFDVQQVSDSNGRLQLQLHSFLPDSETCLVSDDSCASCIVKYEQERCGVGMDELEAELEVELERLQLNLDTEKSSKCPLLPRLKAVMDAEPAISQSFSSEVNPGVSPIEVERRLHELVEGRQQERIKELEAALESALNKLEDKEIEISWWKDTARLVSQRLPASSRLVSNRDPKIFAR